MEFRNYPRDSGPCGLRDDPRMDELARRLAAQAPARRAQLFEELEAMRGINEVLRAAIIDSGESYYSLWKKSGVSQENISRFANGERDIRLETAAKLAEALGLELVPRSGKK